MLVNQLDAKIYLNLINHLQTMPGGYDIVEPGQTYPTEADVAFIVVQDVRLEPINNCIGDDTSDEHRGIFDLSVMTPLEWNHAQTLGIAGLIRDHFPKSTRLWSNDIKVEVLNTPFISANAVRDVAWNRLPVSVRWRASG